MDNPEKTTHTLTWYTRAQLLERKMRQLALELEAFEDPEYVGEVGRVGDDGLEDIAVELHEHA